VFKNTHTNTYAFFDYRDPVGIVFVFRLGFSGKTTNDVLPEHGLWT